mgnify:CR=1 FL=1|tara:strand:+ start:24716 stop:26992 length:2277 start_codon:yes stop_codon:yes gene_type:complete
MADRIEKVVDLKVKEQGAKNVDKTFKEINKNLKNIKKESDKAFSPQGAKKLNKEIDKTAKVTVDVRQKLRDLQNRMAEIGDVGSAEFQQLAAEAGKYKDQMNNANAAIKAMSADFPRLQVGVEGLQAMGAAAQVGTAAMSFLGTENEAVTKSIQQMMAVQALMNAVTTFSNLLSDESAIGLKLRTMRTNAIARSKAMDAAATTGQATAQGGLNIAQKAGAIGMRILNGVMMANPVFLLIAAFAALAAAFAFFNSSSEDASEAADDFTAAMKRQNEELEANRSNIETSNNEILRGMKLEGETAEGVARFKKHIAMLEERDRKDSIEQNKKDYEELGRHIIKLRREENWEKVNELYKEQTALRRHNDKLRAMHGKFKNDLTEIDQEYDKRVDDDRKADVSKYKSYQSKKKAAKKERLDAERKIEDAEFANKASGREKDLEIARVQNERYLADLLTNEKLNDDERKALKEHGEEALRLKLLEINKKYDDIANDAKDKAEELENQKRIEREDAQFKLEIELMKDKKQQEILLLMQEYDEKFALAQGNAELEKQLTEAQNTAIAEINDKYRKEEEEKDKEAKQKKIENFNSGLDNAMTGLNALQGLSDAITENELAKAGDDEEKKEKIRKKAFERNKKLQIVMAIVQGIQGTMAAFTAGSSMGPAGVVMGPLMAAIAAATALANIAKIKNTKFESSSSPKPDTGIGGGGGAAAMPQFNVVGASSENQLAQSLGEQQPVKAFVVAGDVTTAQSLERDKIENASL